MILPYFLQFVITPIVCLLVLFAAVGNALVLAVSVRAGPVTGGSGRQPYVASLSAAHLLMCVAVFPMAVVYQLGQAGPQGHVLCVACLFLHKCLCVVIIYTISLICVEAAFHWTKSCVALRSIIHSRKLTSIFCSWAAALLVGASPFVTGQKDAGPVSPALPTSTQCLLGQHTLTAAFYSALVILPILCCMLQLAVLRSARLSQKAERGVVKWTERQCYAVGQLRGSLLGADYIEDSVQMLAIKLFLFCVSWLPLLVLTVMYSVCGTKCTSHLIRTTVIWLPYVSSWLNPVTYCLLNKTVSRRLKRLCSCCNPRWKQQGLLAGRPHLFTDIVRDHADSSMLSTLADSPQCVGLHNTPPFKASRPPCGQSPGFIQELIQCLSRRQEKGRLLTTQSGDTTHLSTVPASSTSRQNDVPMSEQIRNSATALCTARPTCTGEVATSPKLFENERSQREMDGGEKDGQTSTWTTSIPCTAAFIPTVAAETSDNGYSDQSKGDSNCIRQSASYSSSQDSRSVRSKRAGSMKSREKRVSAKRSWSNHDQSNTRQRCKTYMTDSKARQRFVHSKKLRRKRLKNNDLHCFAEKCSKPGNGMSTLEVVQPSEATHTPVVQLAEETNTCEEKQAISKEKTSQPVCPSVEESFSAVLNHQNPESRRGTSQQKHSDCKQYLGNAEEDCVKFTKTPNGLRVIQHRNTNYSSKENLDQTELFLMGLSNRTSKEGDSIQHIEEEEEGACGPREKNRPTMQEKTPFVQVSIPTSCWSNSPRLESLHHKHQRQKSHQESSGLLGAKNAPVLSERSNTVAEANQSSLQNKCVELKENATSRKTDASTADESGTLKRKREDLGTRDISAAHHWDVIPKHRDVSRLENEGQKRTSIQETPPLSGKGPRCPDTHSSKGVAVLESRNDPETGLSKTFDDDKLTSTKGSNTVFHVAKQNVPLAGNCEGSFVRGVVANLNEHLESEHACSQKSQVEYGKDTCTQTDYTSAQQIRRAQHRKKVSQESSEISVEVQGPQSLVGQKMGRKMPSCPVEKLKTHTPNEDLKEGHVFDLDKTSNYKTNRVKQMQCLCSDSEKDKTPESIENSSYVSKLIQLFQEKKIDSSDEATGLAQSPQTTSINKRRKKRRRTNKDIQKETKLTSSNESLSNIVFEVLKMERSSFRQHPASRRLEMKGDQQVQSIGLYSSAPADTGKLTQQNIAALDVDTFSGLCLTHSTIATTSSNNSLDEDALQVEENEKVLEVEENRCRKLEPARHTDIPCSNLPVPCYSFQRSASPKTHCSGCLQRTGVSENLPSRPNRENCPLGCTISETGRTTLSSSYCKSAFKTHMFSDSGIRPKPFVTVSQNGSTGSFPRPEAEADIQQYDRVGPFRKCFSETSNCRPGEREAGNGVKPRISTLRPGPHPALIRQSYCSGADKSLETLYDRKRKSDELCRDWSVTTSAYDTRSSERSGKGTCTDSLGRSSQFSETDTRRRGKVATFFNDSSESGTDVHEHHAKSNAALPVPKINAVLQDLEPVHIRCSKFSGDQNRLVSRQTSFVTGNKNRGQSALSVLNGSPVKNRPSLAAVTSGRDTADLPTTTHEAEKSEQSSPLSCLSDNTDMLVEVGSETEGGMYDTLSRDDVRQAQHGDSFTGCGDAVGSYSRDKWHPSRFSSDDSSDDQSNSDVSVYDDDDDGKSFWGVQTHKPSYLSGKQRNAEKTVDTKTVVWGSSSSFSVSTLSTFFESHPKGILAKIFGRGKESDSASSHRGNASTNSSSTRQRHPTAESKQEMSQSKNCVETIIRAKKPETFR